MSEKENGGAPERESAGETPGNERNKTQSGPTFSGSPDPLAGVRKATGEAWKSTEGRTVSMRVYIGSIIAVIVVMMLARCGG